MHTQQVAFILAILVLKSEVAATNETKQEKERETGTNTHNGISFIAMWEETKRKKSSDSYFDIEHTFKIIVMGNLWFTCWLPIPLLPASIPVCGEILSLGRTLLHILQCLPPVLSLYSCDCLWCVFIHQVNDFFFLFCTPNFPLLFSLSLFIPLHSLFTCIVNKKSRLLADYQRRQWQKRQTIFFLLLFYSNHEWHWIRFEIESTLILIKWMWGKEGTKKRYIYDDKPNTYRERYE